VCGVNTIKFAKFIVENDAGCKINGTNMIVGQVRCDIAKVANKSNAGIRLAISSPPAKPEFDGQKWTRVAESIQWFCRGPWKN
jgi:hypothetical protein